MGSGKSEEARKYINSLKNVCKIEREYVKTGNAIVDSMINFKLNDTDGVEVTAKVNVPENLEIDSYDLVCILGNLLDNSIEAVKKAKKKFIGIFLKYDKQRLIIKIEIHIAVKLFKKGESCNLRKRIKLITVSVCIV